MAFRLGELENNLQEVEEELAEEQDPVIQRELRRERRSLQAERRKMERHSGAPSHGSSQGLPPHSKLDMPALGWHPPDST